MKATKCRAASMNIRNPFLQPLALAACVLLCTVVLTARPASVEALDRTFKDVSPERVVARLKERLNLTQEQEEKIRPVIEESINNRRELMEKRRESRRAVRSEMQELQWSTELRLAEILTQEQLEMYRRIQDERRQKLEGRRGDRPRGGW